MKRSCKKWVCKKRSLGLTLVEILIAVSLLGLVAVSFAYLYGVSQRFLVQSVNFSASQGEASFALEHIQRNLQRATAVPLPANVGDAGTTLEFTWQPDIAAAVRTSRYQMNGTNLEFVADTAGGGAEVIARSIAAITFTRATQSTVDIEVRAERTSAGDTRETILRTAVSPRGLF